MKYAACSDIFSDGDQCTACKENFRSAWRCPLCRISSSPQSPLTSSQLQAGTGLDYILAELRVIKNQLSNLPTLYEDVKEMKSQLLTLKHSIEFNSATNREYGMKIDAMERKISDIDKLQSAVEVSNKQINTLSVKIENMDQRARLNIVEMKGIPVRNNENSYTIVEYINPNGHPQYFPPQGQIYPNLYNPSNAPLQPQIQPPYPGYPSQGQYQPNPAYPYQTRHPAAMSYPTVTPLAPSVGFGYPNIAPTPAYGMPGIEWIPTTPGNAVSLSDRAVVAGYEGHDGSPLWVIRARFEGDLIPGKLAIEHDAAYVAWGGKENAVQNIEVLCARPERIRWVKQSHGAFVPSNALVAGNTKDGELLYIGRAEQQRSLTPGKVLLSHKTMYMSFDGKEIPHKSYEILCTI